MIDQKVAWEFKGKSVVVTGGTGMIGRQVVEKLCDAGAQVASVSLDELEYVKGIEKLLGLTLPSEILSGFEPTETAADIKKEPKKGSFQRSKSSKPRDPSKGGFRRPNRSNSSRRRSN